MRTSVIYVDTSVIGGCCDTEFQRWSRGLLSDFKAGAFTLLLSELIDAEIQDAPNEVKDIYTEFRECTEVICMVNLEAIDLANAYLNHNILSQNYRNDALHIAVATIAEADLLVSWNFKHIVHFKKIQRFNAINLEMGYKNLLIYSPREVTLYGSEGS